LEEELARLREAALAEIAACGTEAELEAVRVRYLGRKGSLTEAVRGLGRVPPAERPALGALVNQAKEAVEAAVAVAGERLAAARLAESLAHDRIDVTLPGRRRPRGHAHPLRLVEDEIVDVFVGMGFQVAEGPEVEDDYHNFAALNFGADHPARDAQDTLFLADGPDLLLRTHTSPVQIRYMRATQPPLRVVVPGTVYRRDDLDPTHSPMFQQVEGFMVDERVSFADLKGVLVHFLRRLFGAETGVRFRPSFFPFTEPSAEVDIACVRCAAAGAAVEVVWDSARRPRAGAALQLADDAAAHDELCVPQGTRKHRPAQAEHRTGLPGAETVQGFAFGLGTDRIAILRYGIEDLRLFYENDLRFLAQFPS